MTPRWEVPSVTPPDSRRRAGPAGSRFAGITHVQETGSTNADLLAVARSGDGRDGAVLVADHQTAGRGRQGRTWHDRPAGSLLASVLLRAERDWASLVPLATGLAAVDALSDRTGIEARLKWPNDVLVPAAGERKLAGILAEAVSHGDQLWVVVGMGLNLAWPEARPEEVSERLVAVADLGPEVARDDLLDAWLACLDGRLAQLVADRAALLADYRTRCCSIGRHVRMATPAGEVDGLIEDIGSDGALLLRVGGELRRFDAGDVHHV